MKKRYLMSKIEFMFFLLLVFCFTQVFAAPCGDINSSGSIDIVDALLIAQYYVGIVPENFDQSAADVTADSNINIVDALLIAQYYVGLITSLPGCDQTPSPTDPPNTVTLQAEDAYLDNAEVESEHSGYTGSGYVNTENEAGPYIEWAFNASTAGNADFIFTYANSGDSRQMELTVNGNTVVSSLDFPDTGGWDNWSTVSVAVSLISGRNTLRLTSLGSEGGPNLDKLDISFSGNISTPDPTPTATPSGCAPNGGGNAMNHGVNLVGYGSGTTGGGGNNQTTVSSISQLESALQSNVTIYVNGTISGSGMIQIKDESNISVIGVGSSGKFQGVGLSFIRTSNIIIQNLVFENCSEDAINIENTTRVWIDHNTFSTSVNWGDCDSGSVKDEFDGQIDIKKNSGDITVSFNYVHDACKAMLLGFSDGKEPDNHVTYHHNRFENIGSRLPLIRHADTHVYNNYYKNVLISGINVRMGANALIENNYFENVDDPILSADSDEIGYWNVSGNLYAPDGPTYTHDIEDVDVIGTVVNCEVVSTSSWRVNYSYQLDNAIDVPPTVIQYAGAGKM